MTTPGHGKIRWEEMFPDELLWKIENEPVCYLAYGLAEPHGPYNALGLDWLKATALVERVAARFGGVVAPPCAWHIQDLTDFHDDGNGNGWLPSVGVKQSLCSSIPDDLFYRLVFHQIRALDARGFQVAVLVTGHYGGVEKVLRLICEYYTRRTNSPMRFHAIADWECIECDGISGDHAGPTETSQLMSLHPTMVDLSRCTVPEALGTRYAAGIDLAALDQGASRERGDRIVDSQVETLGRAALDLKGSYQANPSWRAPTQEDVDAIWQRFFELVHPYWRFSYEEYKNGVKREFPGWEDLGE